MVSGDHHGCAYVSTSRCTNWSLRLSRHAGRSSLYTSAAPPPSARHSSRRSTTRMAHSAVAPATMASTAGARLPSPRPGAARGTPFINGGGGANDAWCRRACKSFAPRVTGGRRASVRVSAVASPSLPTAPSLPLPDFLKAPLEGIAKQVRPGWDAAGERCDVARPRRTTFFIYIPSMNDPLRFNTSFVGSSRFGTERRDADDHGPFPEPVVDVVIL